MESIGRYCEEAILFLEKMITIPSLSFEEAIGAEFIVNISGRGLSNLNIA